MAAKFKVGGAKKNGAAKAAPAKRGPGRPPGAKNRPLEKRETANINVIVDTPVYAAAMEFAKQHGHSITSIGKILFKAIADLGSGSKTQLAQGMKLYLQQPPPEGSRAPNGTGVKKVVDPNAPKRPRGRPPGSKNKTTAAAAAPKVAAKVAKVAKAVAPVIRKAVAPVAAPVVRPVSTGVRPVFKFVRPVAPVAAAAQ